MLSDMVSNGVVFWLFVAAAILAGVWRKAVATREAHRTIRLAIERNQPLEPAVVDRILDVARTQDPRMRAAVFMAMGLAFPIAGYFLGLDGVISTFYPLTGVGVMFLFVGAAQWIVWTVTKKADGRLDRFES